MTTKHLQKLKNRLTSEQKKKLADQFNVSLAQVYHVFNGIRQNEEMIQAAIQIIKQAEEEKKALENEIENL